MRIILTADNASTRFGGEAFIPLNYFRLMRQRKLDVRLVVHARNRAELTHLFPQDLDRLHFVEDTWLHRFLSRSGQYLPRRLADATTGLLIHLATQFSQRRVIIELARKFGADVIHQPIPVSPKTPSQIYRIGAPVVIGPMNGGMEYPPAFRKEQGWVATGALALGRSIALLFNLIFPGKRLARLLLVANPRTRDALPPNHQGRVVELVENGVDLSIWQRKPACPSPRSEIRLIFVGRLIDWKALEIVLEAVERAREQLPLSLSIIGDGPMRQVWQTTAERLGIASIVSFEGFLAQPECAKRLREADVFVLPSLFECGGAVVLEAMAAGLPVIATAWGGPLDYLDDSCGILVKPDSREALVAGFAGAIMRLAGSAHLRNEMGQAGYERVRRHFDWERKIDQVLEFYASLTSNEPANRAGKIS